MHARVFAQVCVLGCVCGTDTSPPLTCCGHLPLEGGLRTEPLPRCRSPREYVDASRPLRLCSRLRSRLRERCRLRLRSRPLLRLCSRFRSRVRPRDVLRERCRLRLRSRPLCPCVLLLCRLLLLLQLPRRCPLSCLRASPVALPLLLLRLARRPGACVSLSLSVCRCLSECQSLNL